MIIDRQQAKKLGLKQFDGVRCSQHPNLSGKRQTSNGICIGCRYDRFIQWKHDHPGYIEERVRQWQIDNRELKNSRRRNEICRAKRRTPEYRRRVQRRSKDRRLTDINYKLKQNLKSRLKNALRYFETTKSRRTIELIGCSVPELKRHLRRQFKKGMSWKNYGKWHIDHKRPCASFDLVDPIEQQKCFHYTNLQPLWAVDNIRKGATRDY